MALARKYRLVRRDIERVLKAGKTVKDSFFFIKFLENNLGYARLAVVVSLKVSKRSSIRNRLRRIITENVKESVGFDKNYFDIVITAAPTIVGKPEKEIKRSLKQTINKLYVNKNHN